MPEATLITKSDLQLSIQWIYHKNRAELNETNYSTVCWAKKKYFLENCFSVEKQKNKC